MLMKQICLDAGVLDIFFSEHCTKSVEILFDNILNHAIEAYILKPVIIESFLHVCKNKGKIPARLAILSFLKKYPINQVNLDENLIILAGELKCQNRKTLSYIDCMSIAFCLNQRIQFHTTEKQLKNIPNNTLNRLKIVKYSF